MRIRFFVLAIFVFTLAPLWNASDIAAEFDGLGVDVHDCVVRFAEEVEVPALATGRVAEVFVHDNESVEQGTRILQLNNQDVLREKRRLELRLKLAQDEASNNNEIEYAELNLKSAKEEYFSSRSANIDYNGVIPSRDLRMLEQRVEKGKLEVTLAKDRQAKAEIAVDLAQNELLVIEDKYDNLQVKSPLAGVLLEVNKSVGEWVETGETLATVARINRLRIHAILDSKTLSPQLCTGLRVSVHWTDQATGEGHSLDGKVLSVDPQIMPGGRYRLHAEVDNELISSAQSAPQTKSWKLYPGADVRMKVHVPAAVANRNRLLK